MTPSRAGRFRPRRPGMLGAIGRPPAWLRGWRSSSATRGVPVGFALVVPPRCGRGLRSLRAGRVSTFRQGTWRRIRDRRSKGCPDRETVPQEAQGCAERSGPPFIRSAGRGAADLRRTASCDPPSGSGTGQTAARTAGAKDPRAGPSAPRHAFRPAAQGRVGRPSGPVWPSVEHRCGQAGGGWRAGLADPIRSLRPSAPVCSPGPRRFGHVKWGLAFRCRWTRADPPLLSGWPSGLVR